MLLQELQRARAFDKFIFSSSATVYGGGGGGEAITEEAPTGQGITNA